MSVALISAALTLLCTGALTLQLLRVRTLPDPIARLGLAMATGLSVIALLLEFLPGQWTSTTVRLLFGTLVIGAIFVVPWRRAFRSMRRRPLPWHLVTALFLSMVIGVSVAQVNGAPVAPGVDSAHHGMLTRLIVDRGGLPSDLEPYIPQGRLAYHWGAHGNVAFVALLLGRTDPFEVNALVIMYAALLRIVSVLALYAAARTLFANRFAALVSGAIAAGFSALPAELVTQGRFTHLAGAAVLTALVAVRQGGLRPWNRSIVIAILLAGVFLIQARLVVFGVAWILVSGVFQFYKRPGFLLLRVGSALLLAGLLILPWGLRLIGEPLARSMVTGKAFAQDENRWTQRFVPPKLMWLDNNGLLLSGASAGLTGVAGLGVSTGERVASVLWLCVVAFAAYRVKAGEKTPQRKSRKKERKKARFEQAPPPLPLKPALLISSWVVLSAALLFARSPGYDLTSVVPYAAGTLTSYVPMILLASGIVSWVAAVLLPSDRAVVANLVLVACVLSGIKHHPRYEVQSPLPDADQRAMEWIVANTPEDAQFAVMARSFHGIFVGEDAGYWIHVLTNRRSFLPPMIYGWTSPVENVERTNELLTLWTTVHPDTSVPRLAREGVTHAYIGSASHDQARDIMRDCTGFKVIYERDDVMIAELQTRPTLSPR